MDIEKIKNDIKKYPILVVTSGGGCEFDIVGWNDFAGKEYKINKIQDIYFLDVRSEIETHYSLINIEAETHWKEVYIRKDIIKDVQIKLKPESIFNTSLVLCLVYNGQEYNTICLPTTRFKAQPFYITVPNFSRALPIVNTNSLKVMEPVIDENVKEMLKKGGEKTVTEFWNFYNALMKEEDIERMKLLWEVM